MVKCPEYGAQYDESMNDSCPVCKVAKLGNDPVFGAGSEAAPKADSDVFTFPGPAASPKAESDIVSGDFPEFVPDSMNYAGDVNFKFESFRENRVAIYRRNTLLAVKENIAAKKEEYIRVYLPERQKSTIVPPKAVYKMKPAAVPSVPSPAEKKRKTVDLYAYAAMTVLALIIGSFIAISIIDGVKTGQAHSQQTDGKPAAATAVKDIDISSVPDIDLSLPVEYYIEKDGLSIAVRKQQVDFGSLTYEYTFEFTNESVFDTQEFPKMFSGAKNADKFTTMLAFYPGMTRKRINWQDGEILSEFPQIVMKDGKFIIMDESYNYNVRSGEKVIGLLM